MSYKPRNVENGPPLGDIDLLASLRRIVHAMDIHSRRLKTECELTAGQLVSLMTVVAEGPLTATQLARRVHVSTATLVGILDRLEKKSLVARVRDTADRRAVHITATAHGRDLIARAPSPLQNNLVSVLARMAPADRSTLVAAVARVADIMESGTDVSLQSVDVNN